MDAKSNFREGHIMLQRPFDFVDLDFGIPKMTIVYAYIEEPLYRNQLNEKGRDRVEEITIGSQAGLLHGLSPFKKRYGEDQEDYEERLAKEYELVENDPHNLEKVFVGNKVQASFDGHTVSFFPDEYKVVSQETVFTALNDDAYYMVVNNESAFKLEDTAKKVHYLQSRGISKERARKMASYSLKDLVAYFPHPELQKLFCRSNEVIYLPMYDQYYIDVYGSFEGYRKTC